MVSLYQSLLPVCVVRSGLSALICASVQEEWKEEKRRSCKVVVEPLAFLLLSSDLYSPLIADKTDRGRMLPNDESCY